MKKNATKKARRMCGLTQAAMARNSAGRMRHRSDRRAKDARRAREEHAGW